MRSNRIEYNPPKECNALEEEKVDEIIKTQIEKIKEFYAKHESEPEVAFIKSATYMIRKCDANGYQFQDACYANAIWYTGIYYLGTSTLKWNHTMSHVQQPAQAKNEVNTRNAEHEKGCWNALNPDEKARWEGAKRKEYTAFSRFESDIEYRREMYMTYCQPLTPSRIGEVACQQKQHIESAIITKEAIPQVGMYRKRHQTMKENSGQVM